MTRVTSAPRRRLAVITALATSGALVIGMAGADTALAGSPCSLHGTNNYGEACLYGTEFFGVAETIQSAALSVNDPAHYFVDNDMWIVNPNVSPVQFIEAGTFSGDWGGSGITDDPGVSFVWGYQTPAYGYQAEIGGAGSLNTAYNDGIWTEWNGYWYVTVGNGSLTASVPDALDPTLIRTGTEELSTGATACSEQYNLEWADANGSWHTGWSDSSHGDAEMESDSPPYAWWVNPNLWIRDRSNDPTCYGI
jgi:hypothetical protein